MNQQQSFYRLTIYFGMFATIAAGMIGLGQESWFLPVLVAVASTVAIIVTDMQGWFFLHRFLVYVGMIFGAGVAIYGFMNDAMANRLLSVGNLLVYVQLPLMFQKKSKRVFEQWGVFLLLELVVAALVNDNVLYGVLMLPVLGIGCAALMALALFSSHLRHSESISESTGVWSRLMHWLGKEQIITRRSSGLVLTASSDKAPETQDKVYAPSRWRSGILPTAAATLLFSIAYFYTLPRLHSGAFEGDGFSWGGAKIGFSDQISLQFIGEVLQNDSPAFRLSMTDEKSGANYRPNQPPYIRATVVYRYADGAGQGVWQPGERSSIKNAKSAFAELPNTNELDSELLSKRDRVVVSVIEKSPFGEVLCSLPPFSSGEKSPFRMIRKDWRMVDPRPSAQTETPAKRRYSFLSHAFLSGQDSPVLADVSDSFEDKQNGTFNQYQGELTRFPESLSIVLPEMDRMLATSAEPLQSKLSKALYLEDYFANSGEFEYSLSLTGPKNKAIDPMADFVLNKKRGHCQFFASSLALLLRSIQVPTRLVIGFRPSEYNDLGGYFPVLQNHAHVWVEAYFTLDEIDSAEDLVRSSITIPPWATKGVWLRLDPTPPVEGSNAGGTFRVSRLQTLDAMQDLWTEMVMNMDKSKQGSIFSLFAESSGSSYANIWLQIQNLFSSMQSRRFIGGLLSPERWFSWRVTLGIFFVGGVLIAVSRLLPGWFPGHWPRWMKSRNNKRTAVSRIEFYEKAIRLLRKFGIRRQASQTPREFLHSAAMQLQSIGVIVNDRDLSDAFYDKRFGGVVSMSEDQQTRIQNALSQIEAALQRRGPRRLKPS